MKIENIGKGLIPSKYDERDFALSSVMPDIIRYPEVCPAPFDLEITNQGSNPSCVAHAIAGIKQEKELREKISVSFDAEWFYKECKKIDNYPGNGTYLRVAMKLLADKGIKPINADDPTPYKIAKYALIDDLSFEGLKKTIFIHGAVIVGYTGSNEGWKGEFIRPPKAGESIWGHAVRLTSYEKNYLIGENSWDYIWGKRGQFKVDKNYPPFEGWAIIVDAPTEFKPIKTGWVASMYLKQTNGIWKTTANLNVRSEAGLSFGIIETLAKGSMVQLTNAPTQAVDGYVWTQIILN